MSSQEDIEMAEALELFVKKGYLDKKLINNEWYYIDSKKVKKMLKEGKSRDEIRKILGWVKDD